MFEGVTAELKLLVVPEGGELPPEEELAAMEAAEAAAAAEAAGAAAAAAAATEEAVEYLDDLLDAEEAEAEDEAADADADDSVEAGAWTPRRLSPRTCSAVATRIESGVRAAGAALTRPRTLHRGSEAVESVTHVPERAPLPSPEHSSRLWTACVETSGPCGTMVEHVFCNDPASAVLGPDRAHARRRTGVSSTGRTAGAETGLMVR